MVGAEVWILKRRMRRREELKGMVVSKVGRSAEKAASVAEWGQGKNPHDD